jgi:arsenate reductase-like glutaredoxin family protein
MIFIFTAENCTLCEKQKEAYKQNGTVYTERSADRLKSPEDDIDREALIEASMNNMALPVIVEWIEKE